MPDDSELRAVNLRQRILDALAQAQDNWAEILSLISSSDDRDTARDALKASYAFDDAQAVAILDMHVFRLTRQDQLRVRQERDHWTSHIARMSGEGETGPDHVSGA